MTRDVCYRYSDGEALISKPSGSSWGTGETSGIHRVANMDITQEQVDTINQHLFKVDNVDTPINLVSI